MRQPSPSSQHVFSQVPRAEIPRSTFRRDFAHKTTFNAGWLIPFYTDEVLPGDTFSLRTSAFARLATPIKPLMDNMYLDTFFFFVPNRLLWDNWERFNGAQDNPNDSTDFTIPQVTTAAGFIADGMGDHFGLPIGIPGLSVSALWFRAYHLIWNEWFRDQNLQNSLQVPKGNGPDPDTMYGIVRRGKRHDYFTSCLPFPQKGASVLLPLGDSAPVVPTTTTPTNPSVTDPLSGNVSALTAVAGSGSNMVLATQYDGGIIHWANTGMEADLSTATAATINDLRQAFQIQKLLERDARGGTRYTEIVQAHWNVTSPDARLQRPEYLGGGTAPITLSPVAQTSRTETGGNDPSPQANLSAVGTGSLSGHGFTKSFTEHGVIIGLVSARADLTYQNCIERQWSRKTRFDFYWPALAHLGEQAVLRKELFVDGTAADDDIFGYQERYAEYRYKPSQVTGKFRSLSADTLHIWHLAQNLSDPLLNGTFIGENPPIDRVIAVQTEPHFLFDSFTSLQAARAMPIYGVPGLIDHF